MADSPKFYTLIFTKFSLYMNKRFEAPIAKLVNDAFSEIKNIENAPRFEEDSDVSKELGEDGIIATAFDAVEGDERDIAFACISAKKYEPPEIDEDEENDVGKLAFRYLP